MRVKVLGSAAGGGFPQWNCGCSNCRRFRLGSLRATARSQAQLTASADDQHWFLLGASPDLRYQIEACKELQPQNDGRNSPISGVILTCADLDHSLGLLLLREWQRLNLYSTATVRRVLLETNTVFRLLERMPGQIGWTDMSIGAGFNLTTPEGVQSGISARMFGLPGGLPAYAPSGNGLSTEEAVAALILESPNGKRMAYIPGLPAISEALLAELNGCHTILVDGTFWTDDELVRVEGFGRLARDIGHLPVSGAEGSLAKLSGLRTARKVYVHVNNTNPMLDEESEEYHQVVESGWEIAFDGMELTL
jgi:pyrroloquinoline quinone biosynthesis protein B